MTPNTNRRAWTEADIPLLLKLKDLWEWAIKNDPTSDKRTFGAYLKTLAHLFELDPIRFEHCDPMLALMSGKGDAT